MSERCACGSYAINEHLYDRQKGHNSHLCDMCYWQHEARQAHRAGWEQCKREASRIGAMCKSEDDCISEGLNFGSYECGIMDAINAIADMKYKEPTNER